jgi:non-ribosomal peptide synthetase component F
MLMHERTGADDVVFGSVSSGRQSGVPHADTLRGVLVNTQPLRSRAIPDTTVSSWLRSLQLTMAEMREHDHTPLGLIQQWCEVPPQKRPLFDTLVVVANYAGSDLAHCSLPDLRISNVAYYTQPLLALTLFVGPGEELSILLVYDKKRYASSSVRELLDDYGRILNSIAENPEQRLASLTAIR